jgi:RNA polymerase sigma factor (TIGR02999 family)
MVGSVKRENNLTALLHSWAEGNVSALNEALPAMYSELRRLANRRLRGQQSGLTLDAPALVNEAYVRLIRSTPVLCQDREHFFALAATIMRGILVDYVRSRHARKRGGAITPVTLSDVAGRTGLDAEPDLLDIDSALHELARLNARQAQIVEMKFFGGLSIEQTADLLNISPATVKRDWTLAKSWLKQRLVS